MSDKKWTYPGAGGAAGQSVTQHEDGSVTVKDADGTETHYDPKTGNMTKTPPTPPQVTAPSTGPEKKSDGEVRVGYLGKRVRFIPGPPPRFKIVRSAPDTPREEDFNLQNGTRGVVQQEGGDKVETPPTSTTPEEITPSTHPKPAPTPAPPPPPAPAPAPSDPKPKPSGEKKPKKKPKKAKAPRRKKPVRKAKKRPAARRKKSRR